jgi:hypothetical protein
MHTKTLNPDEKQSEINFGDYHVLIFPVYCRENETAFLVEISEYRTDEAPYVVSGLVLEKDFALFCLDFVKLNTKRNINEMKEKYLIEIE